MLHCKNFCSFTRWTWRIY